MSSNRAAVSACIRRVTGVAPWFLRHRRKKSRSPRANWPHLGPPLHASLTLTSHVRAQTKTATSVPAAVPQICRERLKRPHPL